MNRTVLVMAGGTGGHVMPALAVARGLRERGMDILWLGTRNGIEARLVPEAGLPIEWLDIGGLRGKGWQTRLAAPWNLLRACVQAAGIIRRHRPVLALGLGGFASGPGGLMARLMGVPLAIHEQNAVAGLTNRVLARLAQRVMEAYPGSFPNARGAVETGNPVRPAIAGLPLPEARFAYRTGPLRLLVMGGSLGARALNETVPVALARLQGTRGFMVRHQCGARHVDAARAAYRGAGVEAEVEPFIADMAEAYGWADLVIARAGALTVAELCAAGVGALLVPYPHAVDDHQTRNAEWMVRHGAARRVEESALDAARLADELDSLCMDRAYLLAMARAARELGRPEATAQVVEICMQLIAEKKKR
ncbi:MAG: undecaprenyldiphospho-muramoylpentapeptide beta-N-acetylglucosaminyltransferase [Halothiobacillaceae bacterium]|jgi:UDP-N-acetylglucosamine--N-acetylmuramyl-(pentapeptide) pyrophosphoryl-undecaprenol N-acetylglucosamine transferase|nr:undecaprenyldiphospho-muramoylpentapeptide beta-N-acetylglucosaminyltransferase [Halothiobacillaceae bacterium]MDY0050154.1 undecaprenyldiphospho-muramoylpentapeptide beta-N-acetylglucosaminyltransferase [Halothiobacillaceae bacterium]